MVNEKRDNLNGMEAMVEMAKERTEMAVKRTELSAQRSYMNAERTLSVWIRTALAAMIFGIAIDRFGLMYSGSTFRIKDLDQLQENPSAIIGAVLVFFSILMAVSAAIRFISYSRRYKKKYDFPAHHDSSLPVIYAFMIMVFGVVLLLLMLGVF